MEQFNFESLDVYQKSVDMVVGVYRVTKEFPKEEIYGLTQQIRRAAVSVVANIAEGSNRGHKEFSRYLDISRGSLLECVSLMQIALKLLYLSREAHDELYASIVEISKMVVGLRRSLEK